MRDIPLASLSYVIFDFETTGLEAHAGDEIVEMGAVKVEGKRISERSFHSLINPQRSMSKAATQVHGIGAEELATAPLIAQIMPEFVRFLGQGVLVAQNARFDLGFLVKNLARLHISKLDNPILDTMLLSRFLFSYENSHNLDAILNRLKIKVADGAPRHRSLSDCHLTAQALIEMINILERRGLGTFQAIRNCVIKAGPIPIQQPETLSLFA